LTSLVLLAALGSTGDPVLPPFDRLLDMRHGRSLLEAPACGVLFVVHRLGHLAEPPGAVTLGMLPRNLDFSARRRGG
jgi:hypothetical protein